jgi:hypothetical protein
MRGWHKVILSITLLVTAVETGAVIHHAWIEAKIESDREYSSAGAGPLSPDWRPAGMPECSYENHGIIWSSRTGMTAWVCTGRTKDVPRGWEVIRKREAR